MQYSHYLNVDIKARVIPDTVLPFALFQAMAPGPLALLLTMAPLYKCSQGSPGMAPPPQVRGTTKYHLSPHEQRAFAGVISTGIPNTLWRIR